MKQWRWKQVWVERRPYITPRQEMYLLSSSLRRLIFSPTGIFETGSLGIIRVYAFFEQLLPTLINTLHNGGSVNTTYM